MALLFPGLGTQYLGMGRSLADFAEGLLLGCFDYYGDVIELQREDLSEGKLTHVQFKLLRRS